MDALKEYYLQLLTRGGNWKQLVKSYEPETLIYAGMEHEKNGDICQVLNNQGRVLWQAKSAHGKEGAPQNG